MKTSQSIFRSAAFTPRGFRIVVKPGSKLSLQKHFHRSEHWVVVKGTAEVTLGSDVRTASPIRARSRSSCGMLSRETGHRRRKDPLLRLRQFKPSWHKTSSRMATS